MQKYALVFGLVVLISSVRALFAADLTPPSVLGVSPGAGSTVSNLAQVTVTFTEAVTGVEAGDFLVNGNPASTRAGGGNSWTFSFSQPQAGPVGLAWDASHAIYDLAGNRFDELGAGATWSITLVDTIPPAVAITLPTPGAVVGALTQVQVTFREPVAGVDAADLTINGQAATNVMGAGAGPYLFSFAPPVNGTVTMNWAGGHGITDLAPAPNAFAGGSWTNTLNPAAVADMVLNEIMADNLNGIVDEDGGTSDWIELYNRGASAVNLLGWSLSDDPANPGQWVFPAVTLGAGQYLLVWASGKDRQTLTGTNHANFVLGGSEYLGLCNAQLPRVVVSEFAPAYPEQRGDISWGRTAGNSFAYFGAATPKAVNSAGTNYAGFAAKPHASVGSGLFTQPFSVHLGSDTPGAAIYYTVNGSVPSPTNGTLFTGPIPIAGSSNKAVVMLRAAAFKTGLLPSSVETRSYIFPDLVIYQPIAPAGFPTQWVSEYVGGGKTATADTVGDYEMDPQVLTNNNNAATAQAALRQLPVMSLVTSIDTAFAPTNGVYSGRRGQGNQRPVNAEMWLPDGTRVFQADCGFEIQGGSSPTDASGDWKDKKISQRLVFKGDFGTPKLQAKVFEDSPLEEFDTLILDAGLNWWWTHMTDGDQRNRAKFITDTTTCDLMNKSGMVAQHTRYVHLYLDGLYWGLYWLHERMDASAAANYLGGAKEEWDVFKHTGDAAGLQSGTLTSYNAMIAAARTGLANNANYELLQAQLDVPWFTDYMAVNFWVGNDDWPHHNWYAWHRTRGSNAIPWRFVSWDAEHTFKNYAFNSLGNNNLNSANHPGELFRLLTNNTEFRVLFGDRVHKLMFNNGPLYTTPDTAAWWNTNSTSSNNVATTYRKRVDEIWDSIVCESARWGDVATANANNPYTRELHYQRELNSLFSITNTASQTVNYFPLRGSNVLAQFRLNGIYPYVAAPRFSQHGGWVPSGYSLFMTNTNAASVVYFTTNGVDPRVYGSGAPSPQAALYSGTPVSLGRPMIVKARALVNGANWSALNEAAFSVGTLGVPLRITEVNYHPPGGDAYEFIELLNTGPTDLPVGGYYFQGISYTFPLYGTLPAGGRIVLASDTLPAAFAVRYPGVVVGGYFGGSLDNGGERLALLDPAGNTVVSVTYNDAPPWPAEADGGGASLEIIDPSGDPNDPANWRASAVLYGTPGLANSAPPALSIVLNEIMAENTATTNNGGAYPDWVELYNAGAGSVSLTGWSLTDGGNPRRFVFTNGPTLASGAYLVVWCDTNAAAPGLHTGFGLDRDGSGVFLYDANTNRVDAISFGPQLADVSIGRVFSGWGLTGPTPGAANVAAGTANPSGLVINEWLANAAPGGSDWIELYSPVRVALQGLYFSINGAIHRYAALSFLEGGGHLQLLADEQPGPRHLDFELPAAGGSLAVYDNGGTELDRVTYGTQAQAVTAGRYPSGTANIITFPGSASPGASNYVVTYSGPVLNEIMARNNSRFAGPWGNYPDWVEFYNPNGFATNLGGMSLASSAGGAGRWVVPAGTTVGANGYLIISCDGDRAATTTGTTNHNTGFGLSADGAGLHLFNAASQLVNQVEFGFQIGDRSLGLSGGQWKLLAAPTPGAINSAAAPLAGVGGLRFNEWMPDPARGSDWFELFNTNSLPVHVGGLFLSDDPSLAGLTNSQVAPLSFIDGGGWLKFIADGDPSQGSDHVRFNLDHLGDALRLYNTNLALLDAVDFGALPAGVSQGRLPDGGANLVRFPFTPTPAGANYLPLTDVVISEVLTHTDMPLEDAVELANLSGLDVALGGWFLSDSESNFKKYRIAPGTAIGAGGFRVFAQSQFGPNNDPGALVPFTFDGAHGDAVYLSAADGQGNLTGYRSQSAFGAAASGSSLARVVTTIGAELAASTARTLGTNNAPPLVGPVVINEVMYQPVTLGVENEAEEFIELHNLTTNSAPLFDPVNPSNTWSLAGGVQFRFPTSVSIPSRGFLLVVNFDPATDPALLAGFRAKYGVPVTVPVHGPFIGKLDNDGEALEILRPDLPQASPPDAGFVPQLLADRVDYTASSPWPGEAAGAGASLQRRRPVLYGNEPLNWKGESATAGRANVSGSTYTDTDGDGLPDDWEDANGLASNNPGDAGTDADGDGRSNYDEFLDGTNPQSAASRLDAPVITAQPQGQVVSPGLNATFAVAVTGTAPLRYQWRFNSSALLAETNATLVVSNVSSASDGRYSVVVVNSGGFVISGDATLVAAAPPTITAQPASQTAPYLGTASFSVGATGPAPITFQWRRNAGALPGATNSTFVIATLALSDDADYTVVVANGYGAVTSAIVHLTVVTSVAITQQPQNVIVNPGGTGTFVVGATGQGTVRFRWQFNGADIIDATNAPLMLSNCQLGQEGEYRALVTDDFVTVPSATVRLIVKVAPIILIPPVGQTNAVGATAVFTARVSGSIPMTYTWRRGSSAFLTNILYTTNVTLTLTNLQFSDSNYYRLVVTNYASLGGVNYAFTNAVWPVTAITAQPANRTVNEGGSASFSVAASSLQLRYQWLFNGVPIADATNTTLTLNNLLAAQAGGYSALVTNLVGSATSQVASLTVLFRPVLSEPEYLPGGRMRFILFGNSNQTYVIEASTNAVDWPALTNLLATNALTPFTDLASPGVTNRLYRARLLP